MKAFLFEISLFLIFLFALLPPSTRAETWAINPDHSEVRFAIEFLGLSDVHGSLSDMQGNLEWDKQTLRNIKFTIPLKTVYTANKMRDQHLCSSVFFDCQQFPLAQIEINSIIVPDSLKKPNSWFEIQGQLTLKNVCKKFKGLA